MVHLKRFILITALVCASVVRGESASDQTDIEILLDGHRVINIVDDFLLFWEKARFKSLPQQRRLWKLMVEGKYRDYFERAVYRGADRSQRREMLDQFLLNVPYQVEAIRQFNKTATRILRDSIIDFKAHFPQYHHQHDVYIGLSFSRFDGSVRPIYNTAGVPDTLCLGADVLAGYTTEEFQITLAHELFHLYHFRYLLRPTFQLTRFGIVIIQPSMATLLTPQLRLMIEGMAVAAAEAVYPNLPRALYLHFTEEELSTQQQQLVENSQRFLQLMRLGATADQYEEWFTRGDGYLAPPRGGYLLGYEVTKRLLSTFRLEELSLMPPAQLSEHAEEQLASIAIEQILLLTTSANKRQDQLRPTSAISPRIKQIAKASD
jgi:hypothetical protein